MTDKMDLTGNWDKQKGKLKHKFPVLTDADLQFEPGKKDDMFTRLQVTLGKTKGEMQKMMETL